MDPGSKERDSRGASLRCATLDETTRRSYEARLQTEPDSVGTLRALALDALIRRDFVRAVSLFRRLLNLVPNDAVLHNNYGVALEKSNRLNEAWNEFRQAIFLLGFHCVERIGLGVDR